MVWRKRDLGSVSLSYVTAARVPTGRPSAADFWKTRVLPIAHDYVKVRKLITVKNLAKAVGVAGPSVSNWLSGKANPDAKHMLLLIEVIGQDPQALVPELVGKAATGIADRDRRWITLALELRGFDREVAEDTASRMALHHREPLHPRKLFEAAVALSETSVAGEQPPAMTEEQLQAKPQPKRSGRRDLERPEDGNA